MRQRKDKTFFFFIVFCSLLLKAFPVFPDQVVIDSADQFDFACTCMEKGEYEIAVGEFERFIHFFPDDPQVPASRRLIGLCYLKNQNFDKARDIFFQITNSEQSSPEVGKALLLLGESCYLQGLYLEAEYYYDLLIERSPNLNLKNAAFYRLGWAGMQEGRWKDASESFKRVEKNSPLYKGSLELTEQSLLGADLPLKTPAYAGALAAVMPGLGHVYVSRYRDAAVAFFLNGIFIWAAAESFQNDHHVLGGVLTLLEAGWYAGNIYSAVNCTHKYNRKIQSDYRNSLKDQFDVMLFAASKGRVGLIFAWQF